MGKRSKIIGGVSLLAALGYGGIQAPKVMDLYEINSGLYAIGQTVYDKIGPDALGRDLSLAEMTDENLLSLMVENQDDITKYARAYGNVDTIPGYMAALFIVFSKESARRNIEIGVKTQVALREYLGVREPSI